MGGVARILSLVATLWLLATTASPAAAATRTWDNGGGDNLWSTAANWTANTLPTSSDNVVFNTTSTANCTIDSNFTVVDFTMASGYSGTISPDTSATRTLKITGNLALNSGATGILELNKSTNTTKLYLDVTGNVTLTAGTIAVSGGTGTTVSRQIYGTDIQVFGTFTINGGTLDWTDAAGIVAIYVAGAFTHSSGTLELPDFLIVGGDFSNTGTINHGGGTAGVAGNTGSGQRLVFLSGTSRSHTFGGGTARTTYVSDGLWTYFRFNNATGSLTVNNDAVENLGIGVSLYAQTAAVTYSTTAPTLAHANEGSIQLGSDAYLRSGHSTITPVIPDYIVANDRWSTSAWINTGAVDSSGAGIISVSGDFGIRLHSDGTARAFKRDTAPSTAADTCASTQDLRDDTWHFVAATNDGTNVKLYVDGELHNTCSSIGAQIMNGDGVYVGIDLNAANTAVDTATNFTGYLDEVRIYNRALSATEIYALAAGAQPSGGNATHTFTDAFYSLHDLVPGSGTLAFGSNSVGIEGGFWNYGAAVTGSGTFSMFIDGTGKTIRANGQRFSNLVIDAITGSADAAVLREPLYADTLTLTDGTVDATATTVPLAIYAKTVTSTSPVFTDLGASEPIVLDGASGGTVSLTTAPSTLRIADPTETNLVGYWPLDRFTGNTSPDLSDNGNTATLYNGTRATTTKPTLDITNLFAVQCDGDTSDTANTADHVSLGTTNVPSSNQTQTVSLWVYLNSTSATQNFISLRADGNASTVGTDDGLQIGLVAGAKVRVWKPGGAAIVESSSALSATTWYHITYTFDASEGGANGTHRLYIGDTLEDTEAAVAPDTSTIDQILLCAYDLHTTQRMTGLVDEVRIYNVELTAAQIANLTAGRYAGLGGGSTFTLGANSTVDGYLSIDSGTLATSSYTLGVAATTATTTKVSNGGLTVGSAAVTLNAGLSVLGSGALTFASTGGALKLATGTTLAMDGTLTSATGTATTKPTIEAVSGTYYFYVGTATTATPTLNVDGLLVKNTKSDGLYINQAGGATTTTVTQFQNVDFQSGTAAGSHLKIYAQQGLFHFNNLTFDSNAASMSTSYAVHLTGNGGVTTATETRAIVGNGTCTSAASACESTYERDDDATEDGLGDTTGSDGAVIQWTYRNWSVATGTPEGFPSASFDWSTFDFWRTYYIVNNISGGSTDRLYVRDSNGDAAGSAYYYDLPNNEDWIGSPRWTTESNSHYVYAVSTAGRVYKLLDDGSSLALVSGFPYKQTSDVSASTATSPIVLDSAYVYWVGNSSSSVLSMFRMSYDKSSVTVGSVGSAVTVVPSVTSTYVFYGGDGQLYRRTTALGSETTYTVASAVFSGRVTAVGSSLYAVENNGTVRSLTQSGMGLNWSYQDTSSSGHTCSNSSPCTVKNLYYDFGTDRVYYGDKDGHVYSINATSGAKITNWPLQPGTSSDEIATAPMYRSGLLLVGTTTGKVFVINAINGASSNDPTLYRTYVLGTSAVTSISFDRNANSSGTPAGAYMVGTADGRLHYIPAISDPG